MPSWFKMAPWPTPVALTVNNPGATGATCICKAVETCPNRETVTLVIVRPAISNGTTTLALLFCV